MDRATVGHNLRPLERDELITVAVSEADRRVRIVSITDEGLKRVAVGRPGWDRAQAEFESYFGAERAAEGTASSRELYDRMLDLYPNRVNRGALWSSARAIKG